MSNAGTDTFDDLVFGYLSSPLSRTADAYGYTASGEFGSVFAKNQALSGYYNATPLVFDSFDPSVRGIGGNFYGTNPIGQEIVRDLRINWTEVGGATGSATLTGATKAQFFGVASGGGFTKFEVSFVQYADAAYTTVDNVVLGAAVTTVPEPSTCALMAAGLAALGFVSRRRRRALVA